MDNVSLQEKTWADFSALNVPVRMLNICSFSNLTDLVVENSVETT
jgi:hypothetical protein